MHDPEIDLSRFTRGVGVAAGSRRPKTKKQKQQRGAAVIAQAAKFAKQVKENRRRKNSQLKNYRHEMIQKRRKAKAEKAAAIGGLDITVNEEAAAQPTEG